MFSIFVRKNNTGLFIHLPDYTIKKEKGKQMFAFLLNIF